MDAFQENVESLEKTLRNHLDTIAKQEEDLRSFENDRRTLLNEVQELKVRNTSYLGVFHAYYRRAIF